jgi:hypothetical protein
MPGFDPKRTSLRRPANDPGNIRVDASRYHFRFSQKTPSLFLQCVAVDGIACVLLALRSEGSNAGRTDQLFWQKIARHAPTETSKCAVRGESSRCPDNAQDYRRTSVYCVAIVCSTRPFSQVPLDYITNDWRSFGICKNTPGRLG